MVAPVRIASTMGLGVLLLGPLVGCSAGARAVPAATARAPGDGRPDAAARPDPRSLATLPFHLPCASDDVVGCAAGCDDRHVEDCVTLGTIELTTATSSSGSDHAVGRFRAACDDGNARGCLKLGDAYHAGVVTSATSTGEADAYRRACDAGANLGCVAAAGVYLTGRGVGADPAYAAALLTRVCDRGNAQACFELARLFTSGEGVKADSAHAANLFEKACKLGLDAGCLAASNSGEVLSPRD